MPLNSWDGPVLKNCVFLRKTNELIDCLNGAHSDQHKRKRNSNLAPYYNTNDPRLKVMDDYLNYIHEWKKEVNNLPGFTKEQKAAMLLSPQSQRGIEMTIRGFKGALSFLFSEGVQTKFVMARVFCQDILEQYFSQQRGACGGNRNPDKLKFMENMNALHLQRHIGIKKRKGNTTDTEDRILDCTPLPKRPKTARSSLFEKYASQEP